MDYHVMGPCVSDELFFTELVDTSLPGMEGMEVAAREGDYAKCRKIFGNRIRTYLRPELFGKLPERGMESLLKGEEQLLSAADKICGNELTSCGITYPFGDNIDWTYNASPDGYVEWTWQLNRHYHWITLANAYRQTGDEKYARCFVKQFESWVHQAVAPDRDQVCYGNETLCWRSIEIGLRLSGSFPAALHGFYLSEAVTDDVLVDFYKSVWEHGKRLEKYHSRFNWLIMEMNGLGHCALLCPELKDSGRWYDYVVKTLRKELKEDTYADGFQSELSTVYQYIVISNYMEVMKAAEIYGRPMPKDLYDGVEKMLEVLVKLAKPDMETPDIGDGHAMPLTQITGAYAADFPKNQILQWAASGKKNGQKPEYTSVVLPYSGFAVLRTGWEPGDLYACFDAGPFGSCHQHQDKLNLVVYANGRFVMPECGTYAYDTSAMRRYAISTRGHNTARVNGLDQNRQRFCLDNPEEMERHSGIRTLLSEEMDYASGIYEDGYGNDYLETAFQAAVTEDGRQQDKDGNLLPEPSFIPPLYTRATHRRGVMLVKKPPVGMKPFLLVFDQFDSQDENDYEILWHLDSDTIHLKDGMADTGDFTVMTAGHHKDSGGLEAVRGAWYPECQGWRANTMTQGAYRPVWTLKNLLHGSRMETVTLLYPASSDACPVSCLETQNTEAGQKVTLSLKDGSILVYQEPVAYESR